MNTTISLLSELYLSPTNIASKLTDVFNHTFKYFTPFVMCFYMKNITFEDHPFFKSVFQKTQTKSESDSGLWEHLGEDEDIHHGHLS